jgi:endonuclease/exonuclease/phosphatase family metal-dependent hydrolase
MGLKWSKESRVVRLLSYNVEWGFLNLPPDIHGDSCGHPIPNTDIAQQTHLKLIAKNIGFAKPDICFLQEMGSLDAVKYIATQLDDMFGLVYSCYYSNGDDKGNQGVGLLVENSLHPYSKVINIPNFKLNRALGLTLSIGSIEYKIVGVHLKSLYDNKIKKDEAEQESQIQAVLDWVGYPEKTILCGDFNNVPASDPIKKVTDASYTGIIDSDKYVPNITANTYTEFHGKNGKESGSKIDYIFKTDDVELVSSHIIDIQREASKQDPTLRGETSDHVPVLGIFKLNDNSYY